MDTNQVSLTRTMLNISTPNSQGINFAQGEVVKGVVQEVKPDGMVMITIKGQTIEAMTEVPVQPGQQLYLKVDDFRDGKTYLKVVTPQAMEVIENANLSANLVDIGIAAKEENIAMARKLLEYNMPVTASNLNEMAKGVKLLGSATPRSLEIVAFVMSRNLPVDATTLKALEQYTLPESNIAKLLQSVIQSLRELGQANTAQLITLDNSASGGTVTANLTTAAEAEVNTAALPNTSDGGKTVASTSNSVNAPTTGRPTETPSAAATTKMSGPETGGSNVSLAPAPDTMVGAQITIEEGTKGTQMPPNPQRASDVPGSLASATAEENQPPIAGGDRASAPVNANNSISQVDSNGIPVPPPEADAPGSQIIKAGSPPPAVPVAPPLPESAESLNPSRTNAAAQVSDTAGQMVVVADDVGEEEAQMLGSRLTNPGIDEEAAATPRTLPNNAEPGSNRIGTTANSQPAAAMAGGATAQPEDDPVATIVKTVVLPNEEALPQNTAVTTSAKTEEANNASSAAVRPSSSGTGTASDSVRTVSSMLSDLMNSANRTETAGTSTAASTSGNAATGTTKIGEQLNLLRTLIEWMQVDGREPASEISQRIERTVASDKDVIRGLTLLQDAIKSENTQSRNPAVHELLQRIDNLEKELSGQKMFNYLSRTSTDNQFNFYYFSIPVKVGGEMHQCQLKFNKEGRRDLRNADNLNFVVSLDTGKMGMVLFHVNWQRSGSLTLQGVVESDGVAQYLSTNIQGLIGKLNDLGYSVQSLGIKVSEEQIDESLKIRVEEAPLSIRPLGIDITV